MDVIHADTPIDGWIVLLFIALIAVYAARSVLGLALWAAGQAPGRIGRLCSLSSQFVTPRLVRRICITMLGIASSIGAISSSHAATGTGWTDVSFSRGVVGVGSEPSHDRQAHRLYTVKDGDCLWSIASRQLGPDATDQQIERQWHNWYQRNRRVIGADPNVLERGTLLTVPAVAR